MGKQKYYAVRKGKKPGSHMQNFFDCIQDGGKPVSDIWTHHRTMTACHICNIAILLKRKLQWDPVKEDFIGDEQASALRGRRQREPYAIEA